MKQPLISIRPFIGASSFALSRQFYTDWGFEEVVLSPNMSFFKSGNFGFYLQDAYVKDWIDNTMVFLEVLNVTEYWNQLTALDLPARYETVRVVPIQAYDWGKECFVHDPSGILWHIGEFYNK
jgi:catechol 2,3-dioxygenase-like lactoylglutathione lyase family enzyme